MKYGANTFIIYLFDKSQIYRLDLLLKNLLSKWASILFAL